MNRRNQKSVFMLMLLVTCAVGISAQTQPKLPPILSARIGVYSATQFDGDVISYDSAINAKDYDRAKQIRNSIAYHFKGNIDFAYGDFKNSLFLGRAKQNVIFDIAEEVGLGAIGITRNLRMKDILTSVLQGFRGGRKSYDANFFKGQTLSVVITSMDAARITEEATIANNLLNDVNAYPLEQALSDEVQYFYAGTLQSGLQSLTEQTGATMQAARAFSAQQATMRSSMQQQAAPMSITKPKP